MKSADEIVEDDLAYIGRNLQPGAPISFEPLAGADLLITGGGGFLGYYLVQALLHWNQGRQASEQVRVTVYDNWVRGVPGWLTALDQQQEEEAGGPRTLTLVTHDITDPLPADIGHFPFIIHAASIASPTFYRQRPIETMDANVNGLRSLLDYALRERDAGHPVGGFLFFSTSEIYGDPTPEDIPTPENYRGNVSCTGPRACYDESKRYGETLCVNFAQRYELPITIARPFNNYGPGLKITDRRILPDFARNVFAGEDITLLSDGSPTRTFCYIADAITGYFKILLGGRPGEAYNIGADSPEISMRELATRVAALGQSLFGYEGQVVFQESDDADYLVDNPNRRCPVIDKARSELGFDPSITLDEGLERSLLWYHDNAQEDSNQ